MKRRPFNDTREWPRTEESRTPLYSIRDLAEVLGVSVHTLRMQYWRDNNAPKPHRITHTLRGGKKYHFHKDEFVKWWHERKNK